MSTASLDARYTVQKGRILVSGTQALVRLPMLQRQRDLAAGLNTAGYVSGYRGSPLASFDREMAVAKKHLKENHIVFQPGLNEDMAATAVWGTQQNGMFPGARYDGIFSMWYGKGPGVDRSMDVIKHANAVGTNRHGGVLLLTGDDHGAVSSTLPHQSEHDLIAAMVPMLSPGGLADYLDYGLLGWAMSRYSGAWVGFKAQTEIVECSATIDIDAHALTIVTPNLVLPGDGLAMRWPDGPHAMELRLQHKMDAVHAFAAANRIDRAVWRDGRPRFGIVSTGKSWLDLLAALDALGIDEAKARALGLTLYKVGMSWPLEPSGLMEFARDLEEVLVIEEMRPVIEDQVKALLFNLPDGRRPRVIGKVDEAGRPMLASHGELDMILIALALAARLGPDAGLGEAVAKLQAVAAKAPTEAAALKRDAYFCSGCPHSVSTRLPEGSRATTGIGCHMMVIGVEDRVTSTFTQMGGEGGAWIGLAPFTDEKHIFVNMGDGTYFHSGLLAIRAAIAAKVNATYKILYNDAVAMTGGQRHDGENTVQSIVAQLLAEGAKRVVVVAEQPERLAGQLPREVAIHPRDELDAVQRDLREVEGVTAIVYDQVCAAEKRRRRKRGAYPISPKRAFINELVCEGCGDCSAVSNCISVEPVETELGRKRRINQSSCNTDLSCLKGFCPSFVTVEGGTLRKAPVRKAEFDPSSLPVPVSTKPDGAYNMLLAGIGGTGVITVSAILSMAAHLDGLSILTLDQTGLAQKNGAVVSHVRLARDPASLHAARIGPGEADVVLGFDVVVSASPKAMKTIAEGRTQVLLDDHFAPTASFVQNTTIDFRQEATLRSLNTAAGADAVNTVSASRLGTALMGDAIAANMLLLGAAWQRGLVPISLEALDRAIEMNGAGVAMNRAAFAWGRRSVVDGAAVEAAAGTKPEALPIETLDELVERRATFLTAYQDAAYANRYRALVETARRTDPGEGFAIAVAKNAFKLMAYKDEYEVARLQTDTSFAAKLSEQFEGPVKVRHLLAPPALSRIDPRTGHPAKISFGPWIRPVFALLKRGKVLRGTRFDPFGRTHERREERRLMAEYFALVERLSAALSDATLKPATELAGLPDMVRGFGHVKAANIARYEARRAALLASLDRDHPLKTAA